MLLWPPRKAREPIQDRQARIRFDGSRLEGEIAWPHDPLYRPLIGIFVAKTLARVAPTYRRPRGGADTAWPCWFDIDLQALIERRSEMEVVCLETAERLDRGSPARNGDPNAPLEISDLLDLAEKKTKPWDCSGFRAFLELSVPDQIDFLYRCMLARSADPSGMEAYRRQIESGEKTILDLRDAFTATDEFEQNVKQSIHSRLAHWIVWGGLNDVHACLAQVPADVEAGDEFSRRIEPGPTSIAVSALERVCEPARLGSYLARVALGSEADRELQIRWEKQHSALISEWTRQVDARKSARKAKAGESSPLQYQGLLGSMRVGEAGRRAATGGIGSRPGAIGFVFYGPYIRLAPGAYRLSLCLHAENRRGGERASFSIEASYKALLLGWLGVEESAFSRATHVLEFDVSQTADGLAGPWFEFRLSTNGVADLEVFDLSLERLAARGVVNHAVGARNWLPILSVGGAGEATSEGVRGKAGVAGHVFHGPYRALPPGKYVLAVDYEGRAGEDGSLHIETIDADDRDILASREFAVEIGESSLELFFAINQPTCAAELPPALEFRLGKSARADLLVKAVRVASV